MTTVDPPAPRPCVSCPYRRDVPSGVWAETEYALLPRYDLPTAEQPTSVFLCHQNDKDSVQSRICGGWAACHDGDELLALRIAGAMGHMTIEAIEATRDYVSPVPLFRTGAEAAAHGMAQIDCPGEDAIKMAEKIRRVRKDLRGEPDFDEMLNRSSLGSPVAKHLQEQGEEIVQRMKKKESGED